MSVLATTVWPSAATSRCDDTPDVGASSATDAAVGTVLLWVVELLAATDEPLCERVRLVSLVGRAVAACAASAAEGAAAAAALLGPPAKATTPPATRAAVRAQALIRVVS